MYCVSRTTYTTYYAPLTIHYYFYCYHDDTISVCCQILILVLTSTALASYRIATRLHTWLSILLNVFCVGAVRKNGQVIRQSRPEKLLWALPANSGGRLLKVTQFLFTRHCHGLGQARVSEFLRDKHGAARERPGSWSGWPGTTLSGRSR